MNQRAPTGGTCCNLPATWITGLFLTGGRFQTVARGTLRLTGKAPRGFWDGMHLTSLGETVRFRVLVSAVEGVTYMTEEEARHD